ncbi:MAG: nitroreductase family protein, partial [Bacillota bacterium]
DPDKRKTIARLAGGQQWIEECPLFFIFCANLKRSKDCWEEIDPSVLSNTEMFITATVDTALAAQKAIVAGQSLGLEGVYIGGIRNDLQTVCELLDIPKLVYPVFGMCLGYPGESPDQKPRLPREVIFKEDCYHENGDDELLEIYNQTMKTYYKERTGGEKDDTWGRHCGSSMMAKTRDYLGNFLKARGIGIR